MFRGDFRRGITQLHRLARVINTFDTKNRRYTIKSANNNFPHQTARMRMLIRIIVAHINIKQVLS